MVAPGLVTSTLWRALVDPGAARAFLAPVHLRAASRIRGRTAPACP